MPTTFPIQTSTMARPGKSEELIISWPLKPDFISALLHQHPSFKLGILSASFISHQHLNPFSTKLIKFPVFTMNPNFSLPMRPHPRTRSTEDARDSHDSQTASNPQQSELKVRKRASTFRQKLENLENVRPTAS
jgi:hypothetical protein